MASAENFIGHGACPVCHGSKAKFTLSKSSLVCMTCNGCNCQIFARSDYSDEKLRACIRATPSAAAATIVPAAQIEPPAITASTPPKKAAVVVPEPAPAAKGFGLLGNWGLT